MQKLCMALSATILLVMSVLDLFMPVIRSYLGMAAGLLLLVMAVASLVGQSGLKGRRVPSPWRFQSGLARLQLILIGVALVCILIGFLVPKRFTTETMGWTWLGWSFIGYSWLVNQIRLEREGIPEGSVGKD